MAKTKALISFAVTAKLICVFVFAYANIRFSHVAVHIETYLKMLYINMIIMLHFQVRFVCSAEELPKNLFTAGHLSLRDEDNNMKLMDDLGIQGVG